MTEPQPAGTYLVKEIFGPTIQGEGAHAGRSCVFLRFAVCNLACTWCDTDFSAEGARQMSAVEIRDALLARDSHRARLVVVTGGEPALQWSEPLASMLKEAGFVVHMETNGTRALVAPVDWLTVSPKPQFHEPRFELNATLRPSEVKVVVDESVGLRDLLVFESRYDAEHWLLQPCMDNGYEQHLAHAIELVTQRPRWRLSLQIHKIVGMD